MRARRTAERWADDVLLGSVWERTFIALDSAFAAHPGDAARAVARAQRSSAVELIGLHCHIGSNVFAASSFAMAAEVMCGFAAPFDLPELTLGGGLGVAYVEGEEAPPISEWEIGRASCRERV